MLIDISDKNLAGMIFENLEEKLGALRIVSCLNPIEGWGGHNAKSDKNKSWGKSKSWPQSSPFQGYWIVSTGFPHMRGISVSLFLEIEFVSPVIVCHSSMYCNILLSFTFTHELLTFLKRQIDKILSTKCWKMDLVTVICYCYGSSWRL